MFTSRRNPLRGLCCRAVSVCLSCWCIETAKQLLSNFFIAWYSSFLKIPMESPSTGAPNRGGVPKIFDFQPVFQKYWYRYRIPILTPNTDTDPALRWTRDANSASIYILWLIGRVEKNRKMASVNKLISGAVSSFTYDILLDTFNERYRIHKCYKRPT